MVRKNRFLVPKGYRAITLYPFIFVRNDSDKYDKELINHERIHLRQQKELLVILFYIWYLLDFLFKYLRYRNWVRLTAISFLKGKPMLTKATSTTSR